jgi:hypothetical protein
VRCPTGRQSALDRLRPLAFSWQVVPIVSEVAFWQTRLYQEYRLYALALFVAETKQFRHNIKTAKSHGETLARVNILLFSHVHHRVAQEFLFTAGLHCFASMKSGLQRQFASICTFPDCAGDVVRGFQEVERKRKISPTPILHARDRNNCTIFRHKAVDAYR